MMNKQVTFRVEKAELLPSSRGVKLMSLREKEIERRCGNTDDIEYHQRRCDPQEKAMMKFATTNDVHVGLE